MRSLLPGLPATWRQRFHTLLAAALPPTFGDALRFYFRQQYDTFIGEPESPFDFHDGHSLGIFDRFEPLLYSLVYEEIEYRINTVCKGDWSDEGILQQTREWLEDSVGAFVINIVKGGLGADVDKAAAEALLRSAFLRFDYHIHQTLLDLRIEELFEIIVEFPDSTPALKDIHACLAKVEGRTQLARHLVKANQRRLLHPGADTKDILDHYVSTIRALRIIDPPGVLLSIVAEPVRAYLRSREDTIRCIMNALMDESGGLEGELDRAASSAEMDASKEDEEDYRDPSLTWEPDPVDAPPGVSSLYPFFEMDYVEFSTDFRKSKGSDVVQMLISIYDTKDVFIREFQLLLAHRLMSIRDFNVTKEVRRIFSALWPVLHSSYSIAMSRFSRGGLARRVYKLARSCSKIWPTRSVSIRLFEAVGAARATRCAISDP